MTSASTDVKHEYDRIPYLVAYQNNSAVRDVYGGVAELVKPGATGLTYSSGNVEQLTAAVTQLVDHPEHGDDRRRSRGRVARP